jgi:hypothetical protein
MPVTYLHQVNHNLLMLCGRLEKYRITCHQNTVKGEKEIWYNKIVIRTYFPDPLGHQLENHLQ